MDREKFIEKFNEETSTHIDEKWVLNVLERCIEANKNSKFGELYNLVVSNEELSELSQEISKYLRDKGDYYNLIQEYADVTICMNYIMMICGIAKEDFTKAVNVKVKRIEEGLNKNGEFK